VRRDNERGNIEAMLAHGGDPLIETGIDGRSAIALAARRGRGDLLDLFEQRGIPLDLRGVDRLVAACAKGDESAVRAIAADDGILVSEVVASGGTLLAEFAGTGSLAGVRCLLELGVDINALYEEGDGYFGVAPKSTALHVAAWRAQHEVLALLLERGAPPDALDGRGRTPLALAVRACTDSYWTWRRSPRSVEALLRAGASPTTAAFPSGYKEVDELLQARGA
jgi:ankyrin repeat protein